MKYSLVPGHSPVGRTRSITLFKFFFQHYEDFCKTILPNGFEQSVYLPWFYRTAEYDYYMHRRRRAYNYVKARKDKWTYVVEPIISFDNFAPHFVVPAV